MGPARAHGEDARHTGHRALASLYADGLAFIIYRVRFIGLKYDELFAYVVGPMPIGRDVRLHRGLNPVMEPARPPTID